MKSVFFVIIFFAFFCCKNEAKSFVYDSRKSRLIKLYSVVLRKDSIENDTIKSLLIEKKELLVNYLYCGKKIPSIDVQSFLKEINNLEYENFKKFRIGHNFVLDKDTLYFQGRNGVKCQENNSTVLLECSLYQMIFKNDTINYPVTDKIIKK